MRVWVGFGLVERVKGEKEGKENKGWIWLRGERGDLLHNAFFFLSLGFTLGMDIPGWGKRGLLGKERILSPDCFYFIIIL